MPISDVNQGFHLDQSILNLADNRKIELGHGLEHLSENKKADLVDAATRRRRLESNARSLLESTLPVPRSHPPKLTSCDSFFIVYLVHRLLHAVLRAIQFLSHVFQLRLSAASMIAFACGVIEFHADSLGCQRQDALADVFDGGRVFCLHRDKAVGDDCSKQVDAMRGLSVKFGPLSLRTYVVSSSLRLIC